MTFLGSELDKELSQGCFMFMRGSQPEGFGNNRFAGGRIWINWKQLSVNFQPLRLENGVFLEISGSFYLKIPKELGSSKPDLRISLCTPGHPEYEDFRNYAERIDPSNTRKEKQGLLVNVIVDGNFLTLVPTMFY